MRSTKPKPNPEARDPWLVAVLKLLPARHRERAFYVTLGVGLVVVGVALYQSPGITVFGGGLGMGLWRLIGR